MALPPPPPPQADRKAPALPLQRQVEPGRIHDGGVTLLCFRLTVFFFFFWRTLLPSGGRLLLHHKLSQNPQHCHCSNERKRKLAGIASAALHRSALRRSRARLLGQTDTSSAARSSSGATLAPSGLRQKPRTGIHRWPINRDAPPLDQNRNPPTPHQSPAPLATQKQITPQTACEKKKHPSRKKKDRFESRSRVQTRLTYSAMAGARVRWGGSGTVVRHLRAE